LKNSYRLKGYNKVLKVIGTSAPSPANTVVLPSGVFSDCATFKPTPLNISARYFLADGEDVFNLGPEN
jgi:hypothetical protein